MNSKFGVSDIIYTGELYDHANDFLYDLPFYTKWCKKTGGSVLELFCGTGRLTIPLANSGINIEGLDFSSNMIDRAMEKAKAASVSIPFHVGDARSFKLDKKFDLIFIPFNSLHNIYSVDDVERVFSSIKGHLNKNGLFIFDIFNPSPEIIVERTGKWVFVTEYMTSDNKKVSVFERCEYDRANQVDRVYWKHIIDGKEEVGVIDMRCYYPKELEILLKYNGFKVLHLFGDFNESQFVSSSLKQIFICKVE